MSRLVRTHINAMAGYVPGEQTSDPRILKLNTNENPYPPSPRVAATLQQLDPAQLRKYPNPTSQPVREAIAALHGVTPDHVLACNGSDEGLALCARTFVESDGRIGYFDPSYSLYPVLADTVAVHRAPVPLTDDFQIPAGFQITTPLFFITTPNAPTGIQYSRQQITRLCETAPGVVVIDEAYVDFAEWNLADLARTLPNVIIARTLSKSYSLAGLRFGYLLGAPPLIAAMDKIRDSYNVDAITQSLALAAIQDQPYMTDCSARIRQTRDSFCATLHGLGFTIAPSATNFVWLKPPVKSAKELFEYLRKHDILARYFEGPRTRDHLRITIGTDNDMKRVGNVIRTFLP